MLWSSGLDVLTNYFLSGTVSTYLRRPLHPRHGNALTLLLITGVLRQKGEGSCECLKALFPGLHPANIPIFTRLERKLFRTTTEKVDVQRITLSVPLERRMCDEFC